MMTSHANTESVTSKARPLVAALYARCSTARQEQEATIKSQLAEVKERIVKDGNHLPPNLIFVDDGWTGTLLERPALDAMRDAAQAGEFTVLYTYDRGRIARKFTYQEIVIEELEDREIKFLPIKDKEVETDEDRIMQGMQGLFAEYERMKIAERLRRGKMYKARNGTIINGQALYGYKRISKTKTRGARFAINEEEAQIVRMIWQWFGNDQMSIHGIIKKLYKLDIPPRQRKSDHWTTGPVRRLLKCEAYVTGVAHYNKSESVVAKNPRKASKYRRVKKSSRRERPRKEWIAQKVPVLVDDASLQGRIHNRLEQNKKHSRRNRKHSYLLSGLVYCGCGCKRVGDPGGNGNYYYRCAQRIYNYPLDTECMVSGINASLLDKKVWQELKKFITEPKALRKHAETYLKTLSTADNSTKDKQGLRDLIVKVKEEEKRYARAYGDKMLDSEQFEELMQDARQRRTSYSTQLKELEEKEVSTDVDDEYITAFCQEVEKTLKSLDTSEEQRIVRDLVEKVTVIDNKNVEVCGQIPLPVNSSLKLLLQNADRNRRPTKRGKIHSF